MEKLKFDIFSTPWGFMAAAGGRLGLRYLVMPKSSKQAAFDALGTRTRGEVLVPDDDYPLTRGLAAQLKSYFQGKPVEFACKLDFNTATVFQREVWGVTRTIPFGTTRYYGWIADRIGAPQGARAVGQALFANPLPLVVPCHRVTAAHGTLGGYSDGVETKSRLLKLEGVILT